MDIDHIVPLAWAHEHGGSNWSADLKQRFANDMDNLLAVSASANRSKGASSPLYWMPEVNQCDYLSRWQAVVERYALCEPPELIAHRDALQANCP